MYGGQATHIPLRVNQASVIPIIFAVVRADFSAYPGRFLPGLKVRRELCENVPAEQSGLYGGIWYNGIPVHILLHRGDLQPD